MDRQAAERAVVISALTVAVVYGYRSITEGSAPPATLKKLVGVGELPPLGSWATAWGFTFLMVSVIAEASPALGGSFAILIAVGDALANASNLIADVTKQEGKAGTSTSTAASTTATAEAAAVTIGADTPSSGSAAYIPYTTLPHTNPPATTAPAHGGTFA